MEGRRASVIVVDTNLVAYLYLPGPATAVAERVSRRDPEWAAPLLWRSELRSVLAHVVRHRELVLDDAVAIAADAEARFRGREYTVTADAVLRAAQASGCSAYDCEFVVVAGDLGVPLVTSDRQILRAFPRLAVAPDRFA